MGFRKKFTIERTVGGKYNDLGYWEKGETQEINIFASVQPISLQEYNQIYIEGIRSVNAVKIYTSTKLHPVKQGTPEEADVLLFMGRRFRVIACHAYQSDVINHFKAYAQEVDT